ncbi:MAG: hypothetical protein QG597_852 [Actinomycetota bacterium]|nr:hypothetical protein [Actinomycetota bacterium]
MSHVITVYRTRYAPWKDGADEREQLGVTVEEYDGDPDPDEAAEGLGVVEATVLRLRELFCTEPSTWPRCAPGVMWYVESDPYQDPYTGELTEATAHLTDFTPAEEQAVFTALTRAVGQRR